MAERLARYPVLGVRLLVHLLERDNADSDFRFANCSAVYAAKCPIGCPGDPLFRGKEPPEPSSEPIVDDTAAVPAENTGPKEAFPGAFHYQIAPQYHITCCQVNPEGCEHAGAIAAAGYGKFGAPALQAFARAAEIAAAGYVFAHAAEIAAEGPGNALQIVPGGSARAGEIAAGGSANSPPIAPTGQAMPSQTAPGGHASAQSGPASPAGAASQAITGGHADIRQLTGDPANLQALAGLMSSFVRVPPAFDLSRRTVVLTGLPRRGAGEAEIRERLTRATVHRGHGGGGGGGGGLLAVEVSPAGPRRGAGGAAPASCGGRTLAHYAAPGAALWALRSLGRAFVWNGRTVGARLAEEPTAELMAAAGFGARTAPGTAVASMSAASMSAALTSLASASLAPVPLKPLPLKPLPPEPLPPEPLPLAPGSPVARPLASMPAGANVAGVDVVAATAAGTEPTANAADTTDIKGAGANAAGKAAGPKAPGGNGEIDGVGMDWLMRSLCVCFLHWKTW